MDTIAAVFGEDVTNYLSLAGVTARQLLGHQEILLVHKMSGEHCQVAMECMHSAADFKQQVGILLDQAIRHRRHTS